MSQKKQFRAQKAKATIKASETPVFHVFTEKLSAFRLQRPSRKQNRIKRPVFHVFTEKFSASRLPGPSRKQTGQSARLSLLHGKTFGFPLTGTFAKAKPDKAVKRQSGYYGCRKLHKRAEKLGVQVRKCYLSILSMLIKASEGIDTEPT